MKYATLNYDQGLQNSVGNDYGLYFENKNGKGL